MNELLPEGELLPEEIHLKLETLLRAEFLVDATNLISEVKTPWLSISRSSIPANMMLLQHHKKSFSMEKGRLWCCIHPRRSGSALSLCLASSTASWGKLELDPCSHLSQDRAPAAEAAEPTQVNPMSSAQQGQDLQTTSQQEQHSMNPTPHRQSQWSRLQVITQPRFSSNKLKS